MRINFDGVEIEGDLPESELRKAVIIARLNELFPDELELEQVKAWVLTYLNRWRGKQRIIIGLTSADFQELCYTGKALEASRWMAAQDTDFGLAGEAAARGITNAEMAALVLAQWATWQAGSDAIEATYVTAKTAIVAAVNLDEMIGILGGLK